MSENYRFYAAIMAARRGRLVASAGLRRQLDELFRAVRHCEAMWALDEHIERQ